MVPASEAIADADRYTDEMAKSLIDKVFFLDKIDADVIVDFGCADGRVLSFIKRIMPDLPLVGYDADEGMIARAASENTSSGIRYTSSWDEVLEIVRHHQLRGGRACLLLSSVIHEIHSYLSPSELSALWERIWGEDSVRFDHIAIRDMMVSRTTSRPSDPLAVARIRQIFDTARLAQWESSWGSIDENWSLTHFLLTYRYEKNWEREVRENYLPVTYEAFLSSIPRHYVPSFKEHFTLPFLRRVIRHDFGIELADRTHIKLVLDLVGGASHEG